MKILILNCDFDKNKETNGSMLIKRFIGKHAAGNIEIKDVTKGKLPTAGALQKYERIIITGSRASIFDDYAWIGRLEKLIYRIDEMKIRTLGICFGHELIAKSFGGSVIKCNKYIDGFEYIKTTKNGAKGIFRSMPPRFHVYQSHGYYVKSKPKGASILAKSKTQIQAYKLRDFYCLQFHPEILQKTAIKMYKRDKMDTKDISRKVKGSYNTPIKILENFISMP